MTVFLICAPLFLTSCDDDEAAQVLQEIGQVVPDPNDQNNEGDQDEETTSTPSPSPVVASPDFKQDFETFDVTGNWFLSDFGIDENTERENYVVDTENGKEIKFGIYWTKRSRNLLADRMNIDRSLMTHAYTNSLCEPKIEIGKENQYTNSNSENLIAELDTDMSHCGIGNQEPATISIRSFIPTKIGYRYKLGLSYKMRTYGAQTDKSYKNLVVRFGKELEKYDPVFDEFTNVELEILSVHKFSKLVITDNGLPDSYGVLIDNIEVTELGKADNFDACAEIFGLNSKGFKKCVQNEVDTNEICDFTNMEDIHIKYKEGAGVASNRKNFSNVIVNEAPTQGKINFLSLGLKGMVTISCEVGGFPALYDIFGKTLKLREVSWNNATPTSYPELAKVRVKLEGCHEEILNRVNTVATVHTNEEFSFTFNENEDGLSYSGCKMSKLIIKDITPNGSSADGFDLNSVHFEEE